VKDHKPLSLIALALLLSAAHPAAGDQGAMLAANLGPVSAASFAPHRFVTAHGLVGERGVAVWDHPQTPSGEPARFLRLGELSAPGKVALSPNGELVAVAGARSGEPLLVVNVATSGTLAKLAAPVARVAAVHWSADGKWLAVGGEEPAPPPANPAKSVSYQQSGELRLWESGHFAEPRLKLSGPVSALADFAFAPDEVAALYQDGTLARWSLPDGKSLGSTDLAGKGRALAHAAGAWVADVTRDGVDGSRLLVVKDGHARELGAAPPLVNALSAEGGEVVVVAFDRVQLWELGTGHARAELPYITGGNGQDPVGAAFVGKKLLVAGGEQRLWQVWDWPHGKVSFSVGPPRR
jgi:hypothetical protein